MNLRSAFLWTLIVSLSLAAILGIIAIILPDLIGADEEILVTSMLLGLYSLPPLACAIVYGKRRFVSIMWAGMISSFLAWLLWLPMIWGDPWQWGSSVDWDELILKAGFTLTFLALWSAHLGMLSLLRLDQAWPRRVRAATLIVAGILLLFGTTCLWLEVDEEWVARTIAVMAILVGSGTLLTPIIALLETLQRRGSRESVASDLTLKVECPRCGSSEVIAAGAGRCESCGLRMTIEIEEPRCACGYLLFRLSGDRCPECGRLARCSCGCLVDDVRGICPKCGASLRAQENAAPESTSAAPPDG